MHNNHFSLQLGELICVQYLGRYLLACIWTGTRWSNLLSDAFSFGLLKQKNVGCEYSGSIRHLNEGLVLINTGDVSRSQNVSLWLVLLGRFFRYVMG